MNSIYIPLLDTQVCPPMGAKILKNFLQVKKKVIYLHHEKNDSVHIKTQVCKVYNKPFCYYLYSFVFMFNILNFIIMPRFIPKVRL